MTSKAACPVSLVSASPARKGGGSRDLTGKIGFQLKMSPTVRMVPPLPEIVKSLRSSYTGLYLQENRSLSWVESGDLDAPKIKHRRFVTILV